MFPIIISIILSFTSLFHTNEEGEYLVCMHGIMGSKFQLYYMAKNLKKEGWDVVNWGYPSRADRIEEHAEKLVKELKKLSKKKPNKPISFIAHSMGGLVLRSAINHPDCPIEAKKGKIVLMATPNQGSSFARYLAKFSFFKKILQDKSGQQLMTHKNFEHLGQFPHKKTNILVIAGSKNWNPVISEESDGTVTIEETYLSTPHIHKIIKKDHSSLLFSKRAYRITKKFLDR